MRRTEKKPISAQTALLLMAIPFVVFLIIFCVLPLLGWAIAFVDYTPGVSILESKFVGFHYFDSMFHAGSDFLIVMRNTFVISLLGFLCNPVPMILAIMLNELHGVRFKRIIQTLTSLPNFTSWVIVYGVAFSIFSADDGLLNILLMKLHLIKDPTNILGDARIVWYVQTLLANWKGAGWSAIIYLGAIAGIDQELYEAAIVDGAGKFRRIWHITIPGIMPTFLVLTFLSVGSLLNGMSFDQIYVFHNGLVHDKIQTLNYYVYSVGLKYFNFSLSTAAGVFNSVVSLLLLTVAGLLSKKVIGRSIF